MASARTFSSKGGLAYTELRRRITSGELAPGSRLSQYELAEELGMSITPLREAIRRLVSEEWVVMDAHRDVRVAPMSASEARELLEVRFSLEPSATELAALRRTEEEIATMRAAADQLLPVTRTWGEEAIATHRAFHRSIYAASHNKVMIRLLDDLWDKADRYRRIGLELPAGAEPRTIDLNQHHRILELVIVGDGAAAADLVRSHIRNSLGAMVTDALEGLERAYHPIAARSTGIT
ncbi:MULTISPECIES: GntR family transcriptional regulator [unclassified Nocardiopsis]|uniref:GntR family transcriptional regulator n=1 Tax=unclassified Nocardiopsis TaxID=2649073 RepID=UPI00066B5F6B|nr:MULTISPECIES: GntR family transcriptional regulator [unclassified Nocardiopsis]MBQ1080743.1 GntR family transcriptional regulator [Nocardiopsis sp. B62]